MSRAGGQNRSDVLARAQENKRGGAKKKKVSTFILVLIRRNAYIVSKISNSRNANIKGQR
jgi:hypothetical protein